MLIVEIGQTELTKALVLYSNIMSRKSRYQKGYGSRNSSGIMSKVLGAWGMGGQDDPPAEIAPEYGEQIEQRKDFGQDVYDISGGDEISAQQAESTPLKAPYKSNVPAWRNTLRVLGGFAPDTTASDLNTQFMQDQVNMPLIREHQEALARGLAPIQNEQARIQGEEATKQLGLRGTDAEWNRLFATTRGNADPATVARHAEMQRGKMASIISGDKFSDVKNQFDTKTTQGLSNLYDITSPLMQNTASLRAVIENSLAHSENNAMGSPAGQEAMGKSALAKLIAPYIDTVMKSRVTVPQGTMNVQAYPVAGDSGIGYQGSTYRQSPSIGYEMTNLKTGGSRIASSPNDMRPGEMLKGTVNLGNTVTETQPQAFKVITDKDGIPHRVVEKAPRETDEDETPDVGKKPRATPISSLAPTKISAPPKMNAGTLSAPVAKPPEPPAIRGTPEYNPEQLDQIGRVLKQLNGLLAPYEGNRRNR
jgi:hypothetical protein